MNSVREARFQRRMSQLVLFKKIGVWPSRISYIENHLLPAREEEKRKLARALGVSVTELFPENEKANADGVSPGKKL